MDVSFFKPADCDVCKATYPMKIDLVQVNGNKVSKYICSACCEIHVRNLQRQLKLLMDAGNHLHNETDCRANCEWVRTVQETKILMD